MTRHSRNNFEEPKIALKTTKFAISSLGLHLWNKHADIFGSISSIISLLMKFWVTFFSLLEIFTETIILLETYLLLYAAQKLEFFSEVLRFKSTLCSTIYAITYLNYGYWNGALIWLPFEMVFFIVRTTIETTAAVKGVLFFQAGYCRIHFSTFILPWLWHVYSKSHQSLRISFFYKFFCAKLMILANLSLLPWTHFI